MDRDEYAKRDIQREREKKNKHRSRKVKLAIAKQVTEAAKQNTKAEKQKNPEDMVAERVEIADVLGRLLKEDKRKENLPTLREYLKWLMEKIDQKSEGELILDWKKECDSKSDKEGGAGGQHRNKTDSAWNMKHKFLLIRVKKGERKEQNQNREEAETKMAKLINKHIDIWLEKLVSDSGDWKESIFKVLMASYEEIVSAKKIQGEDKTVVLEKVIRKALGLVEKK